MGLFWHLSLHVLTAFVAGCIIWRIWRKPVPSFIAGFLGGVLIDLDHLIDYFLAFGPRFNLGYFLQGYQFLKSDKIYVLFHGWEYVALLAGLGLMIRSNLWLKSAILSISLAAFFHLVVDVNINKGMTFSGYSIVCRVANGFDIEKIVTLEHYQDHRSEKEEVFPEGVATEARQ